MLAFCTRQVLRLMRHILVGTEDILRFNIFTIIGKDVISYNTYRFIIGYLTVAKGSRYNKLCLTKV